MTLGEFRKQTKNMSDDLELEIYTERFNDSTQPTKLDFNTEGYIEFIIDDDRWGLVDQKKIDKAIEEIQQTLYVDSLIFGELIDFKNGKISADDVIEEFNRVTRIEVLNILKRNIGDNNDLYRTESI